jgi:hypothetical protein
VQDCTLPCGATVPSACGRLSAYPLNHWCITLVASVECRPHFHTQPWLCGLIVARGAWRTEVGDLVTGLTDPSLATRFPQAPTPAG